MSQQDDENAILAKYGDAAPDNSAGSYANTLLHSVAQSGTFGIGPYAGALTSSVGNMMTGHPFDYTGELARQKSEYQSAAQANPITSTVGNIVVGIPSAIGTGGESLLGIAGRQALAGGVEGATGSENLADVPKNVIKSAGVNMAGAAVGASNWGSLLPSSVGRASLLKAIKNPDIRSEISQTMAADNQAAYNAGKGFRPESDDVETTLNHFETMLRKGPKGTMGPNANAEDLAVYHDAMSSNDFKRIADLAVEQQPSIMDNIITGGSRVVKSPINSVFEGIAVTSAYTGHVSPTVALIGGIAPTVVGAASQGVRTSMVNSSMRSVVGLAKPSAVQGAIGGTAAHLAQQAYEGTNPETSPEEAAILQKYQ